MPLNELNAEYQPRSSHQTFYSALSDSCHHSYQVPKANLNKHLKKQVAQLLTVIRERQLADGITRKEALQIETQVALNKGMAFK